MNKFRSFGIGIGVACMALIAVYACTEPAPMTADATAPRFATTSDQALVPCPTSSPGKSGDALIDAKGGSFSAGKSAMHIPDHAVANSTKFKLEVVESDYLEVRVTANGKKHYQFEEPIQITLDYSRCDQALIQEAPISVWYIDGETDEMLENMDGVDDPEAQTITFTTDHFSAYAIAN